MQQSEFFTTIGGERYLVEELLTNLSPINVKEEGDKVVVTLSDRELVFSESGATIARVRGAQRDPHRTVTDVSEITNSPLTPPPKPIPKGGRIMQFVSSAGNTYEIASNVENRLPEPFRGLDSVNEADYRSHIDGMPEGNDRTVQERVLETLISEANRTPASAAASASGDGGGALTPSTEFNSSGAPTRRTPPASAEELERRKQARAAKELDRANQSQVISGRLEHLNSELSKNEPATRAATELKAIVAVFSGNVGILNTVAASNTRVKPAVSNTIKAEDRQWHPDCKFKDANVTGKAIDASYALGAYNIELVESAPGAFQGVIALVPPELTEEHLRGVHNPMHQQSISKMYTKYEGGDGKNYVPRFISKATLMNFLAPLGLSAVYVDPKTRAFNPSKDRITCMCRVVNESMWYALRAVDRDGKTTKIVGRDMVPLKTYVTSKIAETDRRLLTQLMFGRSLFTDNKHYGKNKFSQLTPDAMAMFSGSTADDTVFTGFRDRIQVRSYLARKSKDGGTPEMVTMDFPAVKMSTPTDPNKSPSPQFVKVGYNEEGYDPRYRALFEGSSAIPNLKEELGKFRRQSPTAKSNAALQQLGQQNALLRFTTGRELATNSKNSELV